MPMNLFLVDAQTAGVMTAYHAIRRHVLYDLRGRNDYDPDHPDEALTANIPLVAVLDGVWSEL